MLLTDPLAAQDFTQEQIEELALPAILENPKIVMTAVAILRARNDAVLEAQRGSLLSANRESLEQDPNAPVLGNPYGDVTIVDCFLIATAPATSAFNQRYWL